MEGVQTNRQEQLRKRAPPGTSDRVWQNQMEPQVGQLIQMMDLGGPSLALKCFSAAAASR